MTEPLWGAEETTRATRGVAIGDWTATGVAIDSRDLAPGDLFVALTDRRDGHDFIPAARAAGAAAVLASRQVDDGPALLVDDVQAALEALGAAARDRCAATRIAVTGSVGKTSAKELIYACLAAAGPAHRSVKSYNNHWGAPLTLARMPQDTRRAVFELGMNHAGEIRALTAQVRPHIAAITKIAPAHIENLGSLEAIAAAKAEIFEGLLPGGVAVLNADDPFFPILQAAALRHAGTIRTFSAAGAKADARLIEASPVEGGQRLVLSVMGARIEASLAATGAHWAANALLACLCARLAETPTAACEAGLAGFAPPEGRGGAFEAPTPDGGRALIVDDSYNANPESMAAALAAFAQRPATRRIAVLGEMLELGAFSAEAHAGLAAPLQAAGVEIVIASGDGMQALADARPGGFAIERVDGAAAAEAALMSLLKDGDAVLIKGSNASGMGKVARSLKTRATQAGMTDAV